MFLLYALLITPFLFSSRFFFPFISTKTFYFRLMVEIALVLYIVLAIADKRFRPKITKLSVAIFILLGVFIVTSLLGINFYRSFWGNTERGEGLLTFSHVIAYFVMLTGMLQERKQWERYFFASIFVSLAISLYAMLQKYGATFVVSGDVSRISGTIGNASFFGGYLISNIFLALWLVLTRRPGWQKIILWSIIIFEIIILNATKTRGAIIGMAIGVFLMLLFSAITAGRKKIRVFTVGVLLGLVLFSSLLFVFKDSSLVRSMGGLQRVTEISRGDITTESRLLTWEASWNGWKDRFFTGYGYENFNIAFNKYFPAEIFRDAGSQIWFDRAHNVFFEISVTSGIFGILTYLSLFIFAFWFLFKHYREDPENNKRTFIIFFALLVAYFFQNLFVFDTLGTYISFYSILAFIVFLQFAPKAPDKKIKIQKGSQPQYELGSANSAIATVLVIGLIFSSYFFVFKPARANLDITESLRAVMEQRFSDVLDNYKKVIDAGTYANEEARQKLGEAMIQFRGEEGISDEAKQRGFRFAVDELRKSIELAPQDARNYLFLMAVYNNFPANDPGLREEVIRLGKEALKLSPTRPQIYFEMGQAAYSLGRLAEGISYFEKAVELNPVPAESHWNLSLAYILSGQTEAGLAEIEYIYKVDRISKISYSSIRNMIQILGQRGVLEPLPRFYEKLIEHSPNDEALRKDYQNLLEMIR